MHDSKVKLSCKKYNIVLRDLWFFFYIMIYTRCDVFDSQLEFLLLVITYCNNTVSTLKHFIIAGV